MIWKYNKIVPLLFLLIVVSCQGQENSTRYDWPQWRGPDRSGVWANGPDIETLSEENISTVWEVPIGPGYNGPTLASGYVYAMDYKDGLERVICFNAEDGNIVWEYSYPSEYSVGYPTGPRASVLVSGNLAYSLGTMGHLNCFDAETGALKWHQNARETYKSRIPTWGLAASPILEGNKLIVQLGGTPGACLVAFDKDTGEEIWRALDDEASYSTPVLINQAGKRVLICWTGGSICGLNPETGSTYWSIPFKPRKSLMNIADPVYDPPYLFLSSFFDGSFLVLLDQEKTEAELVYYRHGKSERETEALHCCISTPIIEGDYVYGVDSYGEVRCLDLKTGDRIWEDLTVVPKARWANIHFVKQDDKVWGFNEHGVLSLGKLTSEGYVDYGSAKVIDPVGISPNPRNGVCWSHPAFSGNRIYVRSDAKLVCIEIR